MKNENVKGEQQDLFRQLAAGLIPSLPAGILPPGYAFPAGTTYVIQNPTIAITFTNPPVDAEEAADIIRRGTKKLAEDQQWGAAP